jgi:hypothetical protein
MLKSLIKQLYSPVWNAIHYLLYHDSNLYTGWESEKQMTNPKQNKCRTNLITQDKHALQGKKYYSNCIFMYIRGKTECTRLYLCHKSQEMSVQRVHRQQQK